MSIKHILLALFVVVIWGCNFIFIKLSLHELPPLFLCAVRFILASLPAIFFVKLPNTSVKLVILYGLFSFALQFTFIFVGMSAGMTPGLASLLLQVQVFFSIFFGVIFLKEMPSVWQIIGALVSFAGIALIAMHFDAHTSLLGFLLIIAAAASWGIGNLITKKIGRVNMMALVIWGSFFASIPLSLITLLFDGPNKIIYSVQHLSWIGILSVLYIVYISTWAGYGTWNWLISNYAVSLVVPFTLLVPIVGMIASALILNEPMYLWKILAGCLVITGLTINLLGNRWLGKKN